MSDHPFKPGVIVAVRRDGNRFGNAPHWYERDEVLKVHASGNFTLKSDPKAQWRGYANYGPFNKPAASRARQGHGTLILWDENQAEIGAANTKRALWVRFATAKRLIDKLEFSDAISDEVLMFLEEANRYVKHHAERNATVTESV